MGEVAVLSRKPAISLKRSKIGPLETRPMLLCCIILSFAAFPLTPNYMTLNDLEWPFYVKFSLLRTAFAKLFYILIVESAYTRDQGRCGEADCDPQNIWNARKNCGSFVDATLSEP